jgi:NAD(P)-dependent dehydrogenase (short-subunit alcohol dehydrogenase family)
MPWLWRNHQLRWATPTNNEPFGDAMTVEALPARRRPPQLLRDQRVVVLGGTPGILLQTARLARDRGAEVILAGNNPAHLHNVAQAVQGVGYQAFDLVDLPRLERFFAELPQPIGHVLFAGNGSYHSCLTDMDFDRARGNIEERILGTLAVARYGAAHMRPPGTLLFVGGAGSRRVAPGNSLISSMVAALPPLVANLALELAPIRVNLIAPGFVDAPFSASILRNQFDLRRAERRATLPTGRVVDEKEVAALAVHLMVDTVLTGMTFDLDDCRPPLSSRRKTR